MKGVALVWFHILVGIFVIGIVYLVMTQVFYGYIQPIVKPAFLANNASYNASGVNIQRAVDTMDMIDTVWAYWPFFLIFGLLLYGIVASQKREPDEFYY